MCKELGRVGWASFRISSRWLIHIINPVDKTQLSRCTSHRRSTTVSLETYPSIRVEQKPVKANPEVTVNRGNNQFLFYKNVIHR